jgi:sugar transferase (PEP-CTERM/EpsH1 system associated)
LRPRPFHFLRSLAERGHRIDLVSAATSARELDDASTLASYCERVRVFSVSRARSLWSCVSGLPTAEPLQARYCLTPAMTDALRDALAPPARYDVLHVEHLRAALYGFEASGLPRVYDAVDCMSRLLQQTAAHGPTWSSRLTARLELERTRGFESTLMDRYDRVLLTAESEREALLALAGGTHTPERAARVRVVTNGVDLHYFAPTGAPRDPATLVFVGRMAYHANVVAARQLVTEVMPRLWSRHAAARLLIVGAEPPAALRSLAARAGTRIEVTGYVDDVRPYLARATLSISPLRYAVGVQNKVLEAMAMATPVVATSTACAALRAVSGEQLLVGDGAEALAAAAASLLDDAALARRVGDAGRRYVEAEHDWRAIAAELEAIYRDAIASAPAAATGVREATPA